jgi:hypothetical protein
MTTLVGIMTFMISPLGSTLELIAYSGFWPFELSVSTYETSQGLYYLEDIIRYLALYMSVHMKLADGPLPGPGLDLGSWKWGWDLQHTTSSFPCH